MVTMGIVRERLGWSKNSIKHLSKSGCVRKLESCASISPFSGCVCLVVERAKLGSLCLSQRGGVPRMCVSLAYRPLPNAVLGKGSGIMQHIELSLWNFIITNH